MSDFFPLFLADFGVARVLRRKSVAMSFCGKEWDRERRRGEERGGGKGREGGVGERREEEKGRGEGMGERGEEGEG